MKPALDRERTRKHKRSKRRRARAATGKKMRSRSPVIRGQGRSNALRREFEIACVTGIFGAAGHMVKRAGLAGKKQAFRPTPSLHQIVWPGPALSPICSAKQTLKTATYRLLKDRFSPIFFFIYASLCFARYGRR